MSNGLGDPLVISARRRWLRRNRWGLVAIAPILLAIFWFSPDDSFQTLRDEHSEEVVRPGGDGWASYGGVRLRLVGFGPAELVDGDGEPFEVPGGLTAWRVTVGVHASGDPEALLGCRLELEDTAGRRYLDSPLALATANEPAEDGALIGTGVSSADCVPYEAEDQSAPFETTGYYLLPEPAQPVALRVTHFLHEPAYVRLEVG